MISNISAVKYQLQEMPDLYKQTKEDLEELVDPNQPRDKIEMLDGEDSDLDMYKIEKGDTPLLVCRCADLGQVDLVIYNAEHNELFLHHTIDLPFLPLQATAFKFAPLTCTTDKVYTAISGMDTEIEIYELNTLDQIRPDYVLGQKLYINKKLIDNPKSHKGEIIGLAYNDTFPNILLTCSQDGSCKFWDLSNLEVITTLNNVHAGGINNVQFVLGKEQEFITTGIEDQTIKYFDFKQNTEDCIQSLKLNQNIEQLQIIDQNTLVITTGDGQIMLIQFDHQGINLLHKFDVKQQYSHIKEELDLTGLAIKNKLLCVSGSKINDILMFSIDSNQIQYLNKINLQTYNLSAYVLEFGYQESFFMLFAGCDQSNLMGFNIAKYLDQKQINLTLGQNIDRNSLQRFLDVKLNIDADMNNDDNEDVE